MCGDTGSAHGIDGCHIQKHASGVLHGVSTHGVLIPVRCRMGLKSHIELHSLPDTIQLLHAQHWAQVIGDLLQILLVLLVDDQEGDSLQQPDKLSCQKTTCWLLFSLCGIFLLLS